MYDTNAKGTIEKQIDITLDSFLPIVSHISINKTTKNTGKIMKKPQIQ